LTLSQNYLSQLMSLEQWALEYNLSVDQFNASLEQWKAQYEMQVSEITGTFRGSPTLSATQAERSTLASAGEALLKMGIMPSADQLAAMGLTDQQAKSHGGKAPGVGEGQQERQVVRQFLRWVFRFHRQRGRLSDDV